MLAQYLAATPNSEKLASDNFGATAIVNSALALTEMNLEKCQKNPRYCATFKVLVVRRVKRKKLSARAATAAISTETSGDEALTCEVGVKVRRCGYSETECII